MKHINAFKKLLLASFIMGISATAFGQAGIAHPLAFGYIGADSSNWYKDYVGVRFEVTAPLSIAGNKLFSEATPYGGGGEGWTDMPGVTTPIINVPIAMPPSADSCACSGLTAATMTGKIAVIWRGPEGTPCEFGYKAEQAQYAGAIACVIINEYAGGLPLGMSAGASGATVTIPTFMISNADGIAIAAAYNAGDTVKMTITPWGLELQNDLGFFNGSSALWHDYAIPYNQLSGASYGAPYMGADGAFIANFGSYAATHVRMASSTKYISNDGTTIPIHSDTTAILDSFKSIDSIYAFFAIPYNFAVPSNGAVHVTYSILQDAVDQYPNDDTTSYTFYLSDSLYSKGRYDFVNNVPLANLYEEANEASTGDNYYIWGNMYYVKNPGTNAISVQWTMDGATGVTTSSIGVMNVYLLKWVDGSGGYPLDSFIQNGELEIVGIAVKNFLGDTIPGDTSGGNFTCYFSVDTVGDSINPGPYYPPVLDSNSWYYVAPEVPAGWYLGCDGYYNGYPRIYGRNHFDSSLEYSSPVYAAGRSATEPDGMWNTSPTVAGYGPTFTLNPCPFGSGDGSYNTDSTVFSTQIGLIPAVALNTTSHPAIPPVNNGVKVVNQNSMKFNVYPNPTSDYINASLTLGSSAKVVTYTILDGMARDVVKETHYNVVNDNFTYPTTSLPSGNYYMVVNIDEKAVFKKFTVIRN